MLVGVSETGERKRNRVLNLGPLLPSESKRAWTWKRKTNHPADTLKGAEGFSWCEDFLVFGKGNRAQDLLSSPSCSFLQSSHLTLSNKCLKKTASTWLAALTGPFLLVQQKAVFLLFCFSKSREDEKGDYRAIQPPSARHDENFKWGLEVRMSPIINFQSQQKVSVGPGSMDVFMTGNIFSSNVGKQEETKIDSSGLIPITSNEDLSSFFLQNWSMSNYFEWMRGYAVHEILFSM